MRGSENIVSVPSIKAAGIDRRYGFARTTPMPTPYWAACRSNSQREVFAAERLRIDYGMEVFLPLIQTKRAVLPLFRGYLFCKIVEQWRMINSCFGVMCLVKVGDCPCRVPDHEIDTLKSMIDGHGFIKLPDKSPPAPAHVFKRGERVKIIGGPFEGVRAIHSGMRAGDRERILLSLLGSSRPVMVPAHQVVAA